MIFNKKLFFILIFINSVALIFSNEVRFYSYFFHFEKTQIGIDDLIVLISLIFFCFFSLIFRKKIDLILNKKILKFLNKYMFLLFSLISAILFVLGILGYDNAYKYIYRSLYLSVLTSYLSAFFSFSVGKIFKDFEKEDNSTDCDKEKVKKLHFINLFISSFLRLFIVLSTIVVVILIWTLPEGILSDILLRFNLIPSEIFKLFIAKVIYLALTLTIGAIVIYISKIIGNNIYRFIEDSDASELNEKEARAKTLINVTHNIVKVVVFIFIIFSFLQNIGINIAALLAGAGIMGIAVGFGAQSLIKDFFSGFFILFENQYAVGDVVKIGDVSGSVEKITLRITVLRNLEGVVHIIPNGHIASVSNMTQGLSRSVIDIDVAYEENLERVFKVLNELSEEFYNDENWKPHIIKKPEILGVDRIAEYSVVVRFLTTTKPLKRWDVTRELNKRIKNKFDEVGIVIPYPHMKIIR